MEPFDITVESYMDGTHKELADRLMAALELSPDRVARMRVSSSSVAVWLLDRDPRAGQITERKVVYEFPKEVDP